MRLRVLLILCLAGISAANVLAVILPPTDDTSGTLTYNTAKPPVVTKRSLTSLNGSGTTLPISKTRNAFVRFAVEETGMTAGTVEKARLTLYLPTVTKVGDLSLHLVTQDWEETFSGPTRIQPVIGDSFLTIPWSSVVKKQFVIVDVTQQVKDWLTNPGSNFGIAVTSSDGLAVVTVGSKEGSASGYPPLLEIEGTGATSANTPNAIVKRDADGNFIVGAITGSLVGNATSATDFIGALAGDVIGTQGSTIVSTVGGVMAASVASAANLANAATSANMANMIVKRDGSGNFMAGTITGTLAGNAMSATTAMVATNFTAALGGDVIGTQGSTVVVAVGGVAAASVASGANLGNAATSENTPNTIVKRDGSGNFVAGSMTGTLVGNATTATSFTGVLAGDVSGTQELTTVNSVGGVTAANLASGANLANAATTANTPNTIVKRDEQGVVTATAFVGEGSGITGIPASAILSPPPGMVLIPAGAFTMGNSVAADTDITDAAPVSTTVSGFYMDINEVTLSQWQSVQQWGTLVGGYTDLPLGNGKSATHPVQNVSWYSCVKWCNARSEREGKRPVYFTDDANTTVYRIGNSDVTNARVNWTANGYRLPTEAEWEKAARGGLDGKRFPWGDTISQKQANYFSATASYAYDFGPDGYNAIGRVGGTAPATSPGGSFAANGYGLNDMAGNVFEWCWDWYGTPYAGGTDPKGVASGSFRVARGGSWFSFVDAPNPRCAQRAINIDPANTRNVIGFRTILPAGL
jgi:formylglycine-generating enzyme required for sulfatase activity